MLATQTPTPAPSSVASAAPAPGIDLSAVERFAAAHDLDRAHSRQVAALALSFFDQLAPLHGLGSESRPQLHAAALLHDIGRSRLDGPGHEVESLRIILDAAEPEYASEHARLVVASVARYHTGAGPSPEHGHFAALPAADRERVRRLAALLRLADGLDRGHRGEVVSIVASAGGDALRVLAALRRSADAGRRAALLARAVEKGRLAEYVYGKRLVLRLVGA